MIKTDLNKIKATSILFIFCLFSFVTISCSEDTAEIIEETEAPTDDTEQEEEEPVEPEKKCSINPKDGLLILEAESFDLKGKWRIKEDEKASGGKYIEYYGYNSYNAQNLDHEISITFNIPEAKNYLVKWYMRQPDHAEGDKSNDVWMYFPGNIGYAWVNNESVVLEHYEKFVSRGKVEFTYGGALDLHNPKSSSWFTVRFPEPGEYTLKICARSEEFQLDKMVLSSGITNDEAMAQSKDVTETIICE